MIFREENNGVNEDLKYNKHYNAYETNNKKIPNNDYQKLILFKKIEENLKIGKPNLSLPKWKENLEIFLSKRKTYRKKKIRE